MQSLGNYDPGFAYSSAKLANVLFMRGLAARLAETGIALDTLDADRRRDFYARF